MKKRVIGDMSEVRVGWWLLGFFGGELEVFKGWLLEMINSKGEVKSGSKRRVRGV